MWIYEYVKEIDDPKIKEDIWDIVCQCDEEFVPSLSSRNSSCQSNLNTKGHGKKPEQYFQEMIKQNYVLCKDVNNNLIGFMTFISNYSCAELSSIGVSNYISTICVKKPFRNQGILKNMYEFIQHRLPSETALEYVSTRTWSTNYNHIRTLEKIGFHRMNVLKDHRGPGIDTVYYAKRIQ